MKIICSVYKSPKKDEMFLYVIKRDKLKLVPVSLINVFGRPVHVFDLVLTPQKKLAREDVNLVIKSITDKGFFLQMPPSDDQRRIKNI